MKVIQREESMDSFLYDGTKTAVINLKDLRVGDIVEYAFTRKGYNPVYGGHISRSLYFDFYYSVDKHYKKIILPVNKEIVVKYMGKDCRRASVDNSGSTVTYTWSRCKKNPRTYDTNVPAWYEDDNSWLHT